MGMADEGGWLRWSALVMMGLPALVRCNAHLRWFGV